jgi:hypothetical protein
MTAPTYPETTHGAGADKSRLRRRMGVTLLALLLAGCAAPASNKSPTDYPPPGRYPEYSLGAWGDTGLHLWNEAYELDPLQDFKLSLTAPGTITAQVDFRGVSLTGSNAK